MPHKLLVELGIGTQSEFQRFLKPDEVIRGEVFTITLSAKNIGTSQFPGAKVEGLQVQYRAYGLSRGIATPDVEVSCPEIAPGEKIKFYSDECVAMDDGVAWVKLTMKANDGTEIECYQSPTSPMKPLNSWEKWFYVLEGESIRIVALLERILEQLK